jgi:hypothetical protein
MRLNLQQSSDRSYASLYFCGTGGRSGRDMAKCSIDLLERLL